MSADPRGVLQDVFGLSEFRGGQEQVIAALLDGRPALAVFPTGGGKSLCYQLPALMLEGLTVVVSPLIALMKDQVDVLVERGVAAARLDSTLSGDEVQAIFGQLKSGSLKLLYVAPERLANENFQQRLKRCRISMLAIDEAHCISEWGHNFRPDYLKLGKLAKELKAERVLALTATATPPVSADIRKVFEIREEDHVQLSFRRANLKVRVTSCGANERQGLLLERLKTLQGTAIVYVTLQHTAEEVAGFLRGEGVNAKAYHAGLNDEYRAEVQEAFMRDEVPVVVATIAFGMGIDKADIRAVYHYNLPKSLENYVQEIGRAGRDGQPSDCGMLACGDDLTVLENFTYGDTPSPQSIRHIVDHLLRQGDSFSISKYELSSSCDIRPLVIGTILAYLELNGTLAATAPYYSEFRVQFLRDEKRTLAGYDAARQKFLRALFAAGKMGRTWLTLNVETIAKQIGEPEERIRKAIGYLEEVGDLMVKPSGLRHGYRLVNQPDSISNLAAQLVEMFEVRETRDIERLQEVVGYVESDDCLTRKLLGYFGEELPGPCGHCGRCHAGAKEAPSLLRSPSREPTSDELSAIHDLVREHNQALRTPRQLARFLSGLTSPATTRTLLNRRDEFGILQSIPFQDALILAESLNLD